MFCAYINHLRQTDPLKCFNNQKLDTDQDMQQILDSNLLKDYHGIYTRGDGNCLYRGVSYFVNGDEDQFPDIKMSSVFILLQYRDLFELILTSNMETETFESFVLRTLAKNAWGTNNNILAISLLFERTLFTFSYNSTVQRPYRYKYELEASFKQPITIGFYRSHFAAILPKSPNTDLPCTDTFFDYKNIDFFNHFKQNFVKRNYNI